MSAQVNGLRLRYEMNRRGWSASDLARAARLSPGTVSAALAGRPVAVVSLTLMAKALTEAPVIAGIDNLLLATEDAPDLG